MSNTVMDARLLPYAFARDFALLAHRIDSTVEVWVSDATAPKAIAEVSRCFGRVRLKSMSRVELEAAIANAYAGSGGNAAQVIDEYESDLDLNKLMQDMPAGEDLLESADDAPVIRMINALLTQALREGASACLELLSKVAGCELTVFVRQHSTLPLRRGITSYHPELPHGSEKRRSICRLLEKPNRPTYVAFDNSDSLDGEAIKSQGFYETSDKGAGHVDFNNDGTNEYLVFLQYASGAGRGCDYNFFDLLNTEGNGFSKSKKRALLLKLQGVGDTPHVRHPVPSCSGNTTGWFRYNGVTYFETKYPGDEPKRDGQNFHTVSYIKNGEINKVCEANFKLQVEVQ